MKLKSLIKNGPQLEIAEVEIEFIPGIPQIHFLGLPDRIIKESFYRIKSALKSSGYKFPLTQQMIVNIKPSHLRKSSRGVELAVALGILLKTKQIAEELIDLSWVLYGELGLDGSVYEPTDLHQQYLKPMDVHVLTGWSKEEKNNYYRVHELKNFEVHRSVVDIEQSYQRPQQGLQKFYSQQEADFIFLSVTTGFHSLLAGDSGAGKSTLAKSLISFIRSPDSNQLTPLKNNWRPLIAPHQSITPAAFLGGGASLYQGEVERAQNGLLILDELLEFNTEIVETLRGPMVGEKLRLVRASEEREIDCQFQVVATTNLCLCGKWTPLKTNLSCRYSRNRCTKYLEKLSGPFVDRFGMMMFTHLTSSRNISGYSILQRIQRFQEFQSEINNLCEQAETIDMGAEQIMTLYYQDLSPRRMNYLKKIAEVFAIERLIESEEFQKQGFNIHTEIRVQIQDYHRAEQWSITPFKQLEKGMG